jgi:hypothetical protein
VNPSPDKVVNTMDVVSARSLSNYGMVAATVAMRDPKRPVTPPAVSKDPQRTFDGKLVLRVVDDAKGQPIEEALIEPGMTVDDEGVVAQPLLTTSAGSGTIRSPIKQTADIDVSVIKEGYRPQSHTWSAGNIPDAFTVRLKAL